MPGLVADLLAYIDRSPTPYHAVAETERRLRAAGFERIDPRQVWALSPGARRYRVHSQGSLVAFQVGRVSPVEGGFHIVGAHTDSPNLRLKPRAHRAEHGYRQLAVEPYGGVLLHTWLDRDLSLAGRVSLQGKDGVEVVLVDFARPLLRIPSLAIHLDRDVNRKGLALDAQKHLAPIVGLEGSPAPPELIAAELRAGGVAHARAEQILAFDLMAYDSQPAGTSGARGEFIHAPRLDNLASCHAALLALLDAANAASELPAFTRVVALSDHEEVGSRSAQGAAGPLLAETLERVVAGTPGDTAQGLSRALAASAMVSADMAHAVHPNYADRHEPCHRPVIGGGPVIKVNANQAYASDAATAGMFASLCARVDVVPQHFVTRSDLACGSTIGPISAARVGVATVDVGNPMLSMHSCRELAGTADVAPMIRVLAAFFSAD